MKAAFICASPKIRESASALLLRDLVSLLPEDVETLELPMHKPGINGECMAQLAACDAWVFAFPLYVDGIPSHLLKCLLILERFFAHCPHRKMTIYALINCGFFEGEQADIAIDILKNWCERAGLCWGQALGIGAGGMLPALAGVAAGKGPKRDLGRELKGMARNIALAASAQADRVATANFPRCLYQLAAQLGWRQALRQNGLKTRDLYRKR